LKGATKLARGSTRITRRFLATVSQLLKTDLRFQVPEDIAQTLDLVGRRIPMASVYEVCCRPAMPLKVRALG
jgi:hypothetical protein